jgi:hypothetical protein
MPRSLSAVSSLEIRDLNRDQIRFYHPGYLRPLNLLFCLPRVDYNTTEGAFGVHYLTALTACQIVANNAFEKGYLARDERGKDRVSDDETILLQRDYWFFVEGDGKDQISLETCEHSLTFLRSICGCSKLQRLAISS